MSHGCLGSNCYVLPHPLEYLSFFHRSFNGVDLLSSDKKIEISSPYNPVHLTHVGYNLDTGEFTVSVTLDLDVN